MSRRHGEPAAMAGRVTATAGAPESNRGRHPTARSLRAGLCYWTGQLLRVHPPRRRSTLPSGWAWEEDKVARCSGGPGVFIVSGDGSSPGGGWRLGELVHTLAAVSGRPTEPPTGTDRRPPYSHAAELRTPVYLAAESKGRIAEAAVRSGKRVRRGLRTVGACAGDRPDAERLTARVMLDDHVRVDDAHRRKRIPCGTTPARPGSGLGRRRRRFGLRDTARTRAPGICDLVLVQCA